MDFANQKARKVGVFTDSTVAKLLPMQMAVESLELAGIDYEVYDRTRVEPNQVSCVSALTAGSSPNFVLIVRPDWTGGRTPSHLRRNTTSPTSWPLVVDP
jgi:alcohol dehydrogenase class IV